MKVIREPVSQYVYNYQGISDYDQSCVRFLSLKIILAYILQSCVDELKDFTIDKIVSCIEGKPEVKRKSFVPDQPDFIYGMNTVDKTFREENNYFDIVFQVFVPNENEIIRLIINVEMQKDYYPGYSLLKRALYYACRLISSQQGKEFDNPHFNDIKKVYSIWVCPYPPQYEENTITKYSIQEECVIGKNKEEKMKYNVMTIIMINLSQKNECTDKNIIRLLNTLISNKKTYEEKIEIFKNEYHMKTDDEMESEMKDMYTEGRYVYEEAREAGLKDGMQQGMQK